MTEVQSALYNEDVIKDLSDSLFNAYKNFEEFEEIEKYESTEITTAPTPAIEESESFIVRFINFFYEILNRIIVAFKKIYYIFKEILPKIFDKFIQNILLYSKKTKKQLFFTFEQIFEIFQLFGLDVINPETFDKINAALQWKICPTNWIDLNFLYSYKNSLLSNTPPENIDAINDLHECLKMLEKEAENQIKFEEDISRILSY